MTKTEVRCRVAVCLAVLSFVPLVAQIARPEHKPKTFLFVNGKPLPGLPGDPLVNYARCSGDGLTYVMDRADTHRTAGLYTVSESAEVKHFLRKLPDDYDVPTVKDFFRGFTCAGQLDRSRTVERSGAVRLNAETTGLSI